MKICPAFPGRIRPVSFLVLGPALIFFEQHQESFFFIDVLIFSDIPVRFISHFNTSVASIIYLCVCKLPHCLWIYKRPTWRMSILRGTGSAALEVPLPHSQYYGNWWRAKEDTEVLYPCYRDSWVHSYRVTVLWLLSRSNLLIIATVTMTIY